MSTEIFIIFSLRQNNDTKLPPSFNQKFLHHRTAITETAGLVAFMYKKAIKVACI